MSHYAALDVSLNQVALCLVDDAGTVLAERKVASEPAALRQALGAVSDRIALVGLEAGPMSQWLFDELAEAGYATVICESRQAKKFLDSWRNKTDRNDARGLAQMLRTGLYREVHAKTRTSRLIRAKLGTRKTLQSQAISVENTIRAQLREFGLKLGQVSQGEFAERAGALAAAEPDLAAAIAPLLRAREELRRQYKQVDREVHRLARLDEVCQRLMTVPGVGAISALTYKTGVDQPQRFAKAEAAGVHFGLTPVHYQSGEVAFDGRISRYGDAAVRTQLYEAAQAMLTRTSGWNWLKSWAANLAKRRGRKRAEVALARRLAEVLLAMWRDGTTFRHHRQGAGA